MAEILPFQGVRYNQRIVDDLSVVICPPYDIITPEMQQELYHRSQYNFVRLEFGQELPTDTVTVNKYSRSAATLEQWLEQGILKIDEVPAIYLHNDFFTYQGKEYRRRGITGCVRLEEWNKKVVRPHEGTLVKPKSDRVNLLWALQTNTSPILALYEDRGQHLSSLLAAQESSQPIISLSDAGGEGHNVWAITEPEVINQISSALAHQPLYIADGHHRYESALTYQHERLACSPSVSGDEAFNFVMMTLVDFSDPGLVILPPHRLVRGLSKLTLSELMAKLELFFKIEELPLRMPSVWQQVDNFLAGNKMEGRNQVRLVAFGLVAECLIMLKWRDFAAASQMMPYFHSKQYKRLDITILDHIILEKLLALSSEQEEATIAYCYDRQDAVNRVLDEEYQLAFLLSPVKAEVIKSMADAGERMPRKSTYFYPKLPAGIVFNQLR